MEELRIDWGKGQDRLGPSCSLDRQFLEPSKAIIVGHLISKKAKRKKGELEHLREIIHYSQYK